VFIQVIQGACENREDVHRLTDRWRSEIAPVATGWLGGTFGFTDDDQFIGVVRFSDKAAAMAHSKRPEQGDWWAEMEKCFTGPITFHDCDDVSLMLGGGSDEAKFVQVIQGKAKDVGKLRSMMADTDDLHRMRPDILGATLAIEPDGTFIETVSFTTEQAARAGETKPMPADMEAVWSDAIADAKYFDLHEPWFASAN
jgi:hypothetical protein